MKHASADLSVDADALLSNETLSWQATTQKMTKTEHVQYTQALLACIWIGGAYHLLKKGLINFLPTSTNHNGVLVS
jgi:hypothetical protein